MENLTEKLMSIPKFGKGIGLHRMKILCEDVLNSKWVNNIDPINVVGTNGKGSTTMIISNILKELGLLVGQYTSPHLFEFSERIAINNTKISSEDLSRLTTDFFNKKEELSMNDAQDQIGAFEAFTSIALSYFSEKKPDAIVLEAGIGGRYDSTRILTGNFVAFTSLDLEHTRILGYSEELIAYDKIDIAKHGSTVITGNLNKDVLKRLKYYAALKNISLLSIDEYTKVENVSFEKGKMILNIDVDGCKFEELVSNLIGYHQINNILVSILLLKRWLSKNYPKITIPMFRNAVHSALENIKWTGRLEKINSNPSIFIDVGHTPNAIDLLVKSFKEIKESPCLLIVGVSHDKEIKYIVNELVSIADAVVCTKAYHKGMDAEQILDTVNEVYPKKDSVFKFEKIEDSIDFAMDFAKKNDMDILIAGGLFLSVEAYCYIKGNAPSSLRFF